MSISAEPPAALPATSPLAAVPAQPEPASAALEPAEPLPPSDADLIAASRSGDAAAYATLYQRHAAAAHRLAGQLVRGPAEADDVVAESFAKVLDLLRRGGGPEGAFRPYLLTAVRRSAYDRHRAMSRQLVTDQMEAFDPGVPFADPAVADLERSMVARAFASLPERWQAVLWHTEIEGARPAEVASLLGLTANGVAALAYRAREGLRQAYLQMHLSGAARGECRLVAAKLGAYVRGGLAKRDAAAVAAHLEQCADCQGVFAELGDVNVALRGIIAPLILGSAAAAYLSSAAGKGAVGGWTAAKLAWFRHAPKQAQAAAMAGAATVAAAGVVAAVMTLTTHPGLPAGEAAAHRAPPPAAAAASARPVTSSQDARRQHPPVPASSRSVPSSSAPPSTAQAAPLPATQVPATSVPATQVPATSVPATPVLAAPAAATTAPKRYAQLTTQINPVGTLEQGGVGMVAFTVTNMSTMTAAQLTADVTLPSGVSYLAAGTLGLKAAGPGGWTCDPVPMGATCTHGPLSAGASASSYLQVVVAGDAPAGSPPVISVGDGGRRVSARGTSGVTAPGYPGQFGAAGRSAAGGTPGSGNCGPGSSSQSVSWQPYWPRCQPTATTAASARTHTSARRTKRTRHAKRRKTRT